MIDVALLIAFAAVCMWVGHRVGDRRATEGHRATIRILSDQLDRAEDAIEAQDHTIWQLQGMAQLCECDAFPADSRHRTRSP